MLIKMTTKPVGCSILYYSFFLQERFQFQIRVNDEDPLESDDLIDRVFVISNGLAISNTFSPQQTSTGIYGNVRAVVSYKAVCQTNYYGSRCTVFCVGRDDNTGHYECNSEGQPTCLQGWTDTETNCLTRKIFQFCDKCIIMR